MKLYLHTPYYKNSNFMAHICEHLAIHPRIPGIEEYMHRYYDCGWSLEGEHSFFDFNYGTTLEENLDTLHNPSITTDIVNYETEIFTEEFWARNYTIRLVDKIIDKYQINGYSSQPQPYSVDEIIDYHDNNYRKGVWVARDSDNKKIIDHNISNINPIESISLPEYKYHEVLLEWLSNHIWVGKNRNVVDMIVTDIIEDIFTDRDFYQKRYQLGSYYTQWAVCTYNSLYMILRLSPHTRHNITPEYIESYKKNVGPLIIKEKFYLSKSSIGLLYHWQLLTSEHIFEALNMITYEYLMSLLDQMKIK